MRVALVTTSYPAAEGDPSGHFVRAEVRELEQEGHEVAVIAPPPGGAFGWPGLAARVREKPARIAGAAWWVASARVRVAGLDAQRVVAHWAVPCAWPVGIASPAALEVVSHGGDVRLLVGMPRAVRGRIVRSIVERAMTWRFVSEALKKELLDALPGELRARLERVAVVRPAALEMPDARELRDAIARRRSELGGARVAVSVGRLVHSKRVDRAIEYVARTRGVEALIVVGDGPERSRLEQLARSRGVDARFVGLESRIDALSWIGAAEVLLFASEKEGASTVLREAAAMRTRVLRLR